MCAADLAARSPDFSPQPDILRFSPYCQIFLVFYGVIAASHTEPVHN
jgi:hypothetical protein